MADQHRLNTFVPERVFRGLKIWAAENGMKLHEAAGHLLWIALENYNSLPASGSRPEDAPTSPSMGAAMDSAPPKGEPKTAVIAPYVGRDSREEINPDEIVRCGLCGQEMPQSAKEIHEENCRRSQQGYWDRKAFSV